MRNSFTVRALYLFAGAMNDGSRKIQGRGEIQRPGDIKFFNTTSLSPDKTIYSVRYYNRRKQELNQSYADLYNSKSVKKDTSGRDLTNQVRTMMKNESRVTKYITEVEVVPHMKQDISYNFDERKYPLNEDEIVQVAEPKQFQLKNYYQFIYETESEKQMKKFVEDTEAKVKEVVHDYMAEKINAEENGSANQKSQHNLDQRKEDDKNADNKNQKNYGSKANKLRQGSGYSVNQLHPIHTEYPGNKYEKNMTFTFKEKQRQELANT